MAKRKLTKEENERLKELAKALYLHENITSQKELAVRIGVRENTIGKWIADGKWANLKKNFLLTREERMSDLLDELTELQNTIKTQNEGARFADHKTALIRRMLINDIKALEVTASKPEIIAACMDLIKGPVALIACGKVAICALAAALSS